MNTDSQPVSPRTRHTQVQGQVSADAPRDRLSSFPCPSAAGESVLFTNLTPRNDSALHRNMTIAVTPSPSKTHSASRIEAV
jgi:hypothetical protein